MAIEKETAKQKQIQEQTLADCKESIVQRTRENASELKKKATQAYDKQCQNLSKQYERSKKMFTDVVDSFSSAVTGYSNPEDVDIDAIVAPLQAAFEPIVDLLSELHIDIPGLSMLMNVFSAAKSASRDAKSAEKKVKDATAKAKAQLTSKDRNSSEGLQSTATTIMVSMSMMFINILINMIAKILEMLLELLDTFIDSDNLPYPLNLVPKALKALPKIISLAMNFPTQLGMIFDAVCIKYNSLIADAKDATGIDDIEINVPNMPCPAKAASLAADNIANAVASQAKSYIPSFKV